MKRLPSSLPLVLLLVTACGTTREGHPGQPLTVRVLTYNIHHGEGVDGVFDLERLARVILSVEPDLVALQEVDVGTGRAGGVDQAAELGRLTGLAVSFAEAMPYDGGSYGEAVLSRWPILEAWTCALPASAGHEPRAAAAILVSPEIAPEVAPEVSHTTAPTAAPGAPGAIGDGRAHGFVFAGTHLDHTRDAHDRMQQVSALAACFSGPDQPPSILTGDFNARPGSPPMSVLEAFWDRVPVEAAATYPSWEPARAIDHVLTRPRGRWRVVEARVLHEPVASDHAPLLVVLEFLPAEDAPVAVAARGPTVTARPHEWP